MNLRFWNTLLPLALALCAPPPAAAQDETPGARLDINRATAEEFARLRGIGPTRAAAFVRIRDSNGPFRSIAELRALPRLPENVFARLRKQVTVTPEPGKERLPRTARRRDWIGR